MQKLIILLIIAAVLPYAADKAPPTLFAVQQPFSLRRLRTINKKKIHKTRPRRRMDTHQMRFTACATGG